MIDLVEEVPARERVVVGERPRQHALTQLSEFRWRRFGRWISAGLLSVAAGATSLAGCTSGQDSLAEFYGQKLSWGGCGTFAVSEGDKQAFADPSFDCAWLRVPLDYGHPGGPVATVAVLRHKATEPGQKIGSLVVNPGGPGAAGTSYVTGLAQRLGDQEITRRFDLVGFDPRGVGSSQPGLKCLTPAERDADRLDVQVDHTPAGVVRIENHERDYGNKCLQRSGGDQVLANAGTRDVVRDMDVLRAALGDQKLTYLGLSYGTRLGFSYAEQFPHNVRALVLDGALDPHHSLELQAVDQAGGFQHAFDAFAAWCAHQPECPLGADPAHATGRYHQLVLPLIEHPVALAGGRALSYDDAITATVQALYSPQRWDTLRQALAKLANADGGILMQLADDYDGRRPDGTYTYKADAFNAIRCVDDKPITDPTQDLQADTRRRQLAPFLDDGHGPSPARNLCAFWPVPNTLAAHPLHITGLPPVLIIAVTGDPATPYRNGVNLATELNARLLTVEGTQHAVALHGTPCIDTIVTHYLTDLALPPDHTRCTTNTPH